MPTERKAGLAVTRALALAAACVALVSCGKPKLDTSTPQTTDASLARMRKALTVQQQEKLNEALVLLSIGRGIHAGGPAGLPPFVSKNPDPLSQGSLKPLHGKTAEDIIAEADHVLAERREKERAQALIEIKDLEAAKEAAEKARLELARFEVVKSRFSQRPDLLGNRPLIELTVKNGTPHPVSRAFFRGTLASPGRAIPWLRADFDYQIQGGLEPGESATWSVELNRFSVWAKVDASKDAILTVEVMKLAGADDAILFNADFPADKQQRLDELKGQYR